MKHKQIPRTDTFAYIILIAISIASAIPAAATETAMWGFTPSRNLVSDEKNLPVKWDAKSGLNIKWTATLGSQTYAGPLLIGGKVFVGTNNQGKRNPKLTGDRASSWRSANRTGNSSGNPPTPNSPPGVSTIGPNKASAQRLILRAIGFTISPTALKSSASIPKASWTEKTTDPSPRRPTPAKLMGILSGSMI